MADLVRLQRDEYRFKIQQIQRCVKTISRQRLIIHLHDLRNNRRTLATQFDSDSSACRLIAGSGGYVDAIVRQLLHEDAPLGAKWPRHFQSLVLEMKCLVISLETLGEDFAIEQQLHSPSSAASNAYDLASRFIVQFSRADTFGRTFRCWNANYWAIYQRRQIAEVAAMVKAFHLNSEAGARDALLAVCAMSHQICRSRPAGAAEVAPYLEPIPRLLRALP